MQIIVKSIAASHYIFNLCKEKCVLGAETDIQLSEEILRRGATWKAGCLTGPRSSASTKGQIVHPAPHPNSTSMIFCYHPANQKLRKEIKLSKEAALLD